MTSPLVVSLELDDVAQARFDRERLALFPPGRTQVGAHVTLFHALPGSAEPSVVDALRTAAHRPPFAVDVHELMPLGRGVAYRLRSEDLDVIHTRLQRAWWPLLTAQDRQGFRAHVTVQNKVAAALARSTLIELQSVFQPFDVAATGLRLWRYDGGPWTRLNRFPFEGLPSPEGTGR